MIAFGCFRGDEVINLNLAKDGCLSSQTFRHQDLATHFESLSNMSRQGYGAVMVTTNDFPSSKVGI